MADSPVVWELRAHATGQETVGGTPAGGMGGANVGFGYGGNGALVPQPQAPESGDGMKGKAIWVMGRRAVENNNEENNGQSYVPLHNSESDSSSILTLASGWTRSWSSS